MRARIAGRADPKVTLIMQGLRLRIRLLAMGGAENEINDAWEDVWWGDRRVPAA